MKATILDTKNGLTAVVDGPRSWEWYENNYSCDCNRNPWNAEIDDETEFCGGCKRFLVIAAEMNSPDDDNYTLFELNHEYPKELLIKHGIISPASSTPEAT